MRKLILATVAVLALTSAARAEHWVPVTSDAQGRIFEIDFDSIHRNVNKDIEVNVSIASNEMVMVFDCKGKMDGRRMPIGSIAEGLSHVLCAKF